MQRYQIAISAPFMQHEKLWIFVDPDDGQKYIGWTVFHEIIGRSAKAVQKHVSEGDMCLRSGFRDTYKVIKFEVALSLIGMAPWAKQEAPKARMQLTNPKKIGELQTSTDGQRPLDLSAEPPIPTSRVVGLLKNKLTELEGEPKKTAPKAQKKRVGFEKEPKQLQKADRESPPRKQAKTAEGSASGSSSSDSVEVQVPNGRHQLLEARAEPPAESAPVFDLELLKVNLAAQMTKSLEEYTASLRAYVLSNMQAQIERRKKQLEFELRGQVVEDIRREAVNKEEEQRRAGVEREAEEAKKRSQLAAEAAAKQGNEIWKTMFQAPPN